MKVIKREGNWRLFDCKAGLLLMRDETLDRIIENPKQPLQKEEEKGFSSEHRRLYDTNTTLMDLCMKGVEKNATRFELSYDFFFGRSVRENYPDSPKTVQSYKIIYDVATQYGMGFSASVVSPLDVGGGYAKNHDNTGYTCQFKEGSINTGGDYEVE